MATQDQRPMLAGTVGWGDVAMGAAAAATAYYGYNSAKRANEANAQLAQNQMDFQADMSNTSYQRAIADLQQAGINPMLVTKMGGASTPGGATATMNPEGPAAMSSAQTAMGLFSEVQRIDQNAAATEQIKAATKKIESETLNRDVATSIQAWNLEKLKGDTKQSEYDYLTKQARFDAMNEAEKGRPGAGFRAEVDKIKFNAMKERYGLDAAKAESDFYKSDLGQSSPTVRHILTVLKGITSAIGALR